MSDTPPSPSIYRPRSPRASPLWQIVHHSWTDFLADYESKYRKIHGPLRSFSIEAVEGFYQCGDLSAGFTRLVCPNPDCGHERLLAFTCKSRHVCPACHQRRVCATGNWIAETLCKPVPHRQFVFTMPRMLRGIFRKRRHLLDHLFKTATDSLRDWMRIQLGLPDGKLAAIAGVQTFGDYLVFHPHLHILSASGLFDQAGLFHLLPAASTKSLDALTELFRHRFIQTLVSNNLLTKKKARELLNWKHSGFNLDAGEKPVAADDVEGRRQLAEYLLRAPFSLQKITWKEETATVIYRSGRNWKTKRNFEVFSATDFIAAAVEHIPDRYHHTIRYYGLYSNKSRGLEQRRNPIPISCQCAHPEHESNPSAAAQPLQPAVSSLPPDPNRKLRPLWRDLILRVWGEDPLLCPKCKTTMKVVDKILRPEEIEFFLKLHDLWEGILAIPPPPDPPFDVETLEPIRTTPEYQWWKPEESDPAQFELTVPHWSPDFEFQDWQRATDSADSWQGTEILLDADTILILDAEAPAQDEFTEFFYD